MKRVFYIAVLGSAIVAIGVSALVYFAGLKAEYRKSVTELLGQNPPSREILKESDIRNLPAPVKKYLIYTGSLNREILSSVHLTLETQVRNESSGAWLSSHSEQYDFFQTPARFNYMSTFMNSLPVSVLHSLSGTSASVRVKIFSLITVVEAAGPELNTTERVALLRDLCYFAPSALVRDAKWEALGPVSAKVIYTSGGIRASGNLYFNSEGQLVNFVSEDRFYLMPDRTLKRQRWSSPMKEYREFSGRRTATSGESIWNLKEGDFSYEKFDIKSIDYNAAEFK